GLRPDAFSFSAAIAAIGAIFWHQALGLLDLARNRQVRLNQFSSNGAVSACEKACRWEWAVALFRDKDLVSGNGLLRALARAGLWREALRLLREMQEKMQANEISYNSALSACEESQQWMCALHLLDGFPRVALRRDIFSLNTVLGACEAARHWRQ
ncbi:unnamed protein product, partial [Effrenium voratum]